MEQRCGINFYQVADEGRGFFVEAGYDEQQQRSIVLRSFQSAEPLGEYVAGVELPQAW